MAILYTETSGRTQPSAQRHIPENLKTHNNRCENLETRVAVKVKSEFPLNIRRASYAQAWLDLPVMKHFELHQTGFAHAPSFVAKSEHRKGLYTEAEVPHILHDDTALRLVTAWYEDTFCARGGQLKKMIKKHPGLCRTRRFITAQRSYHESSECSPHLHAQ